MQLNLSMKIFIQVYEAIKRKVNVFSKYLRIAMLIHEIGRKLALSVCLKTLMLIKLRKICHTLAEVPKASFLD